MPSSDYQLAQRLTVAFGDLPNPFDPFYHFRQGQEEGVAAQQELHEGVSALSKQNLLIVWDRELLPDQWELSNKPVLHLRVGDHIMENLRSLPRGFKEKDLKAALKKG